MRILSLSLVLSLAPILIGAGPSGSYDSQGAYVFPYGTSVPPTLACAPNRVCELRLQDGEAIYDEVAGDTVHWALGKGAEGDGGLIPVIFFEPLDTCDRGQNGLCNGSLTTNLIITTDRRTYEVKLIAQKNLTRARYGFSYPRDYSTPSHPRFQVSVQATEPPAVIVAPSTSTVANEDPTVCLRTANDYRIDVSGRVDYAPHVVCNDGARTYLLMPRKYTVPSIYAILDNGQQSLVNAAAPQNDILSFDGVPNRILMIGGVGKNAAHVEIWKIR